MGYGVSGRMVGSALRRSDRYGGYDVDRLKVAAQLQRGPQAGGPWAAPLGLVAEGMMSGEAGQPPGPDMKSDSKGGASYPGVFWRNVVHHLARR